jgi:hypothetical protein
LAKPDPAVDRDWSSGIADCGRDPSVECVEVLVAAGHGLGGEEEGGKPWQDSETFHQEALLPPSRSKFGANRILVEERVPGCR